MKIMACTYHHDSAWLLCRAHAHDGSHANGGALEIHPAEGEKQEIAWSELPKLTNSNRVPDAQAPAHTGICVNPATRCC